MPAIINENAMNKNSADNDRDILQKIKEKSDDNFEKNITYISAGALGLSMTFIEKIVTIKATIHYWLLFSAWGLLTLTLLINLLSHYLSSYYHEKTTEELDTNDKNINNNIDKRNKCLRIINIASVFTLIIGIIFLILFTSINICHMKDEDSKQRTTITIKPENTDYEKLGRTITKPASTINQDQEASSASTSQNSNNNNSDQNGETN
jgi:multidrug efflux pump subunit AcrB